MEELIKEYQKVSILILNLACYANSLAVFLFYSDTTHEFAYLIIK